MELRGLEAIPTPLIAQGSGFGAQGRPLLLPTAQSPQPTAKEVLGRVLVKYLALFAVTVSLSVLLMAASAEASILSGITKIVNGILYVPASTLRGAVTGPPAVGLVLGALNGVLGGVTLVTQGAFDLVASGIGIAKRVAPFVLPFVL